MRITLISRDTSIEPIQPIRFEKKKNIIESLNNFHNSDTTLIIAGLVIAGNEYEMKE